MFKIYGDYGYIAETLLEEFDNFDSAVRWVDGYISNGDFGGHMLIEVIEFDDNDKPYVTLMRWDAEGEAA